MGKAPSHTDTRALPPKAPREQTTNSHSALSSWACPVLEGAELHCQAQKSTCTPVPTGRSPDLLLALQAHGALTPASIHCFLPTTYRLPRSCPPGSSPNPTSNPVSSSGLLVPWFTRSTAPTSRLAERPLWEQRLHSGRIPPGCEGHALRHVVMWDLCVPDVPSTAPGPPGSELRRAQEGFVE